jgi:5-deoxy-glucuronate isomerase
MVAAHPTHGPTTDLTSGPTSGPSATVTVLLEPGSEGRLGVARSQGSSRGSVVVSTEDAAAWILVEGGEGELSIGGESVHVAGRDDVFTHAGWSALIGPGREVVLEGALRATFVWRAEDRELTSRIIDPADVTDEVRGEGTTQRRVRTYVDEGPLIVGETLNPAGLWSSYPPHRHEHEEIYLYRFDPPHGFGLQMRSESDVDERAIVVRDGRIERITSGWHPVVAAPGATLYYLWALAGADTLDTEFDARYQ